MSIFIIGIVSLFIVAGASLENSDRKFYKHEEPNISEVNTSYCEYDDAKVRGETVRLKRCWKSFEEKESIERIGE